MLIHYLKTKGSTLLENNDNFGE